MESHFLQPKAEHTSQLFDELRYYPSKQVKQVLGSAESQEAHTELQATHVSFKRAYPFRQERQLDVLAGSQVLHTALHLITPPPNKIYPGRGELQTLLVEF